MVFTNMTKLTKRLHCVLIPVLFFLIAVSPTLAQQTAAPTNTPATPEIKIEFNKRVPMRDRTELSADIYRPTGQGRFPVVLNRSPHKSMEWCEQDSEKEWISRH